MTPDSTRRLPISRSGFDQVSVYDADTGVCAIDLSDNTNLWGVPPSARRALESFSFAEARRYPSAYSAELKQSLARYTGVEPSMVVTGCGSDDVLDAAIRAFGNHMGSLTCCDPTFSMISVLARVNGVDVVSRLFRANGDLPIDEMLSARSDIIYVCSPNNPTGMSTGIEQISSIADQFEGLVIVDCAYAEYSEASMIPLLGSCGNVLITRTMSKAFGMAGLRVGYALGSAAIVAEVEKSRGPYKVNALASVAAIAAIENDLPWVEATVAEALANRSRLVTRLESLGHRPMPSDANFILLPLFNAVEVATTMFNMGVAVRAFSNLAGIGPALRITIGPWEMMEIFLTAFERPVS
ncbi:MAG: histidinol-phosphate transaminase [Gemmatimonadaceae bacterium]